MRIDAALTLINASQTYTVPIYRTGTWLAKDAQNK